MYFQKSALILLISVLFFDFLINFCARLITTINSFLVTNSVSLALGSFFDFALTFIAEVDITYLLVEYLFLLFDLANSLILFTTLDAFFVCEGSGNSSSSSSSPDAAET